MGEATSASECSCGGADYYKSELHIGIPLDALNILFPNLYPEAAAVSLE